ncbi:hypothetical protein L6452_31464 [Arctium lappa]|uniref:Uncharacterized protein n=1 Tax=Arctium lappa TaxID=4217 RepID=A0ACB8Z235_ARCLA|nr:hypothetical protein L6452_31464 [Arctium lappa]
MLLRASPTIFLPNGTAADAGENFSGSMLSISDYLHLRFYADADENFSGSMQTPARISLLSPTFSDYLHLLSFVRRPKEGVLEELGSRGADTVSVAYIKQSPTAVRKGGCEFSFWTD